MAVDLTNLGRVSRLLPQKIPDTVDAELRLDPYGSQLCVPMFGGSMVPMADEGTYFYAANATAGTGIVVTTTAVAYTAISPIFMLQNMDVTGGKNVYPDFIKLTITTLAGTPGTNVACAIEIDTVNRYTSGGTQFTPVNTNTGVGVSSIARTYGGALLATALTSTTRRIANCPLRSIAPVVFDTVWFTFGSVEKNMIQGSYALATAGAWVIPCPGVSIGPNGHSLMVYVWSPAEAGTGRYYEFSAGWIEK
jgi:hypothetical protein